MAKAAAQGGLRLIEITWNSDRAAALIHQLREDLPYCLIGAGTLMNLDHQQDAIAAGAQFLFSPHTDSAMLCYAQQHNLPMIPGALSPTEIIRAWQMGATCVKVFPVGSVGGAAYIRSLQEPLATIPLIPTGGITLDNASQFLTAGAVAVGLAGDLFPKLAIAAGDWDTVTERARYLVHSVLPYCSPKTHGFLRVFDA